MNIVFRYSAGILRASDDSATSHCPANGMCHFCRSALYILRQRHMPGKPAFHTITAPRLQSSYIIGWLPR